MVPSYEHGYYLKARNEGSWDAFPRRNILEHLLARLKAGDSVLDIGCGTAEILTFIPEAVYYTGIESSEYALENARRGWSTRKNTKFVGPGLSELASSQFRAILLLFSLEHIGDPQKILRESIRILCPGGLLFLAVPNLELPLAWPNALRHRSFIFRLWFILVRFFDYFLRIIGVYTFRTIDKNFTEATGRYEKKDDDLRYLASSWEIIKFLEKEGLKLEKSWQEKSPRGWRAWLRLLPALRWYGTTLAAVFRKV